MNVSGRSTKKRTTKEIMSTFPYKDELTIVAFTTPEGRRPDRRNSRALPQFPGRTRPDLEGRAAQRLIEICNKLPVEPFREAGESQPKAARVAPRPRNLTVVPFRSAPGQIPK